jgi:hypothetical protein
VSERKPVGSTRTDKDSIVDLIGDDSGSAPSAGSNGISVPTTGPSTQDLLADIFGTGGDEPVSAPVPPAGSTPAAASARSANADMLSLFSSSAPTSAASAAPSVASQSGALFDMMGGPSSAPPPQAQAPTQVQPSVGAGAKPQLQSYPAYEKNGLKITLTPKVSPTQPGVVQILARFTATEGVQGVNFQVAVPKVSGSAAAAAAAAATTTTRRVDLWLFRCVDVGCCAVSMFRYSDLRVLTCRRVGVSMSRFVDARFRAIAPPPLRPDTLRPRPHGSRAVPS